MYNMTNISGLGPARMVDEVGIRVQYTYRRGIEVQRGVGPASKANTNAMVPFTYARPVSGVGRAEVGGSYRYEGKRSNGQRY